VAFKEDLQRLSAQVSERKQYISNEQTTKQSLVTPFLQTLGFDVFNPLEVKLEYIADFGKKRSEKVDFAIFKNDVPILFIEVKEIHEPLDTHDAQLARYFNATPDVKVAILTNGVIYRFFTDLRTPNIMDETPFLTVDVTDPRPSDFEALAKFQKDEFDKDTVLRFAEDLSYTANLNAGLRDMFKSPPDDFVRYLIKDFSDIRVTAPVIERFRPIVKKSIYNALMDIVSQGLLQQETAPNNQQEGQSAEIATSETREPRKVVTTEDELRSFQIICDILKKAGKDIADVNYKDTTVYFAIYNRILSQWFLRLNYGSSRKQAITRVPLVELPGLAAGYPCEEAPKNVGESRVFIDSPEDLKKIAQVIVRSFDEATRTA
jgi:hypothetical protein